MTPVAERLAIALEAEKLRMHNEWFFKWHFIGPDGPVEIDNFRGDVIQYGGIKFSGSARLVYWDTIKFYLKQKIGQLFAEVEEAIKSYPTEVRPTAIIECQSVISGFAGGIRRTAVEKDRILRGDGINFPPQDQSQQWTGGDNAAIQGHADGLRAVYCLYERS